MDMNIFKEVNALIAAELQDFAKALPTIVSEKGEIQHTTLIDFLRRSLHKFEKLNVANTEFLVFKLSDLPSDAHVVAPDKEEDLQTFNAKFTFIEKVFSRIRNTDLFFRDGQRIISFFYHGTRRVTHDFLHRHYENLVSYAIAKRDLRERYTNALLVLTGVEERARSVEAEFCREATRKTKLIQGITIDDWPVVKSKEDKLKDMGKEYGFSLDTTLLVLLQKWHVFPDTVVFFYPMPRPEIRQFGQGGIVWGVKFHDKPDINALWSIEMYALLLCSFVDKVIQVQHQRIARRASLRSAVAAIMARNMSHHEGSHILPRARVSDILLRLQELELGLQPGYIMAVIQDAKDRLDEYIAKKQDFLAEITSEPLTTTKTAYFWQDVIAPMVQNVLLMDTIAANEGVRYADKERNRLVLKVFFNGREVKVRFSCTHHDPVIYPDSYPYTGFCPRCNRYNEQALLQFAGTEGGGDFAVELPGPVGEHAVYTFLENLIRNATKHNLQKLQTKSNQSVEVCINVAEEDEEFYKVEVSENLSEAIVAQKLEGYIKTPLIDDAGELKREAWGIAEMKVAAALLKGSTEWEKLQGDTAKEFLDVKEKDGKLVYRLYMMRPKRVCALVPNHGLEVADIEGMKRAGVWIFRDIQEVKDALYKSRSPASFKFAFFDLKNIANQQDLESLDLKKELERCLPFRVIVRVKSKLRQQVQALLPNAVFVDDTVSYSISDPEKFVCELWRSWLGRWAEKAELHLYLGQEEGQKPTSDWKALAEKWSADGYRPFIWYDRRQTADSRMKEQVSEPRSENSEPPRVVFDRHAVIANQLKMGPELGIKDCYFAFDKLNSDFTWIFSSNPSEEMVYSLLEAGLLRILVVDSRIAEKAYDYDVINQEWTASLVPIIQKTIFPGVPVEAGDRPDPMRWHIGCIGKVFICTHLGINGDPLPLHPSAREVPYLKLRVDMRDSSPSACIELKSNEGAEMCKIRIELDNGERAVSGKIDFDMIIIHQGDIESRRPEGFKYSDFIASLKRLFPFVVVDSGRGIPPEVQSTPGVKFLPFSLLNSYLGGKRIDKARLTQVVMPLRRRLQQ
jgi:hypothetical protein